MKLPSCGSVGVSHKEQRCARKPTSTTTGWLDWRPRCRRPADRRVLANAETDSAQVPAPTPLGERHVSAPGAAIAQHDTLMPLQSCAALRCREPRGVSIWAAARRCGLAPYVTC